MKLNINAIALASGIVTTAFFVICALLVWFLPQETTRFASWWAHIDFSGLTREVTLFSFVGGAVVSFVFGYVPGWAFAWAYNRFAK